MKGYRECLNIMWFYIVSKFWFPYCCKSNTGPGNLFHVFKITYLLLQTDWKRKKSLVGVSYPIYLGHFSINSNLKHSTNPQSGNTRIKFAVPQSHHLTPSAQRASALSSAKLGVTVSAQGKVSHEWGSKVPQPAIGVTLLKEIWLSKDLFLTGCLSNTKGTGTLLQNKYPETYTGRLKILHIINILQYYLGFQLSIIAIHFCGGNG